MNEAKKYMNEAKKYKNEILKLVDTSKASSKTCIDTSTIINTDKDSIDEKVIEETIKVIDNNDSINEKIIMIKKGNRLAIFEDTKPNISKVTKPNIRIDKETFLDVFSIVRHNIRKDGNWETWIFWKSHVTELCEKWICCRKIYAYTRFEEFRSCSGEVLFTNKHKTVFSKN